MNIVLFMMNGVNFGTSEFIIIALAIFVVFLIVRNIASPPKE
ncbi:hypothetical protein [Pedobacter sp. L105]|nr:hypothetical protein [Pedobacter sp. L105]